MFTPHHPLYTPHHPSSCHDYHHYPVASTAISRRRFVQLATLGGGVTLLGLATPWRLARAETLHEPPIQRKPNPKTALQVEAGHDADPQTGTAPGHTTEALLLSCMDYRLIECLLSKHLHTVTAAGFKLRVALFILACSLNFVFSIS